MRPDRRGSRFGWFFIGFTCGVMIGFLMAACSARAEESKLFRGLGYGMYAAQVGDIVSTEMFIARGHAELNPLWQDDAKRRSIAYPAKIGLAYGVNRMTAHFYRHGHPLVATFIRAGIVAGTSAVVTRNFQLSFTVQVGGGP